MIKRMLEKETAALTEVKSLSRRNKLRNQKKMTRSVKRKGNK